ncbi:putative alpha-glucan water dikinase 2 [Cocos nucifera]|uniref:Putative alpha-glucan water dikinase 2 n=1 Tax=Cocos nucifera TaxID=13894 RepID=A0A8K0NB12_COCNU|nr:putative alpha-glucan water dikinase 2 [Cocos nucifera]
MEFEEARKELQLELDKGISLSELRKKIMKGNIQTKVSKQLKTAKYFTVERIQRKKRDIMQLLNKYSPEIVEQKISDLPKAPTVLELCLKPIEEQHGGVILNKEHFKLDDKGLLVLVTNALGKTRVYLATDWKGPLILHWALSKKAGEWMVPPSSMLPPGSVLLDKSCQTPFGEAFSADMFYQAIEIEIDGGDYNGMPFVLLSDGKWMKNNGSDFYIDFGSETTKCRKDAGDGRGTAKSLLDKIAELESDAQRSLMHRFNIAADLMEQARDAGQLGFAGILVWMRFMATRQLIWNKNYNVKPREISKAQDRLTDMLQNMYKICPQYREILRMIMSTVGRGGEGDVGQRIRDEILVIQRNNDCKGGMMEEWHQKLHNNTSPDDVVICQALIDYVKSDFDIKVYWDTLNKNGITRERLLSYDRAIHSEPNFRSEQKAGLLRDLGNYMRTLKAVHSGADLESAIATCMGYKSEGEGFMVGIQDLLEFILDHLEDKMVEPLLEGLLEARAELRQLLLNSHERLKDLIFLDIALDSTVRTAIERAYEELNNAEPEDLLEFILDHLEDKMVEPLLEGLLEARAELRQLLLNSHERLKDLIFLDIALDSTVRTAIERAYEELNNAEPEVCFATCFDSSILTELRGNEGKLFRLTPTSSDILYSEIDESEISSSAGVGDDQSPPSLTLVRKQFAGRYAISAEEFTSEMVGAKSRNISFLKGKVPSWIGIPTSVALPFGVFEKAVADNLQMLKERLRQGEFGALHEIRKVVLQLAAPPQLVQELKEQMQGAGMPWPGDEGVDRWEQAWMAIEKISLGLRLTRFCWSVSSKVWASKWNERAYFSTRKVKLDHDSLCMAVLVQEIISADYAFVIHTTNPSSGDSSEIYAEVVKGLGETLVGAYPGRALSFICKKNDLNSPEVLNFPSKPIGLFIRRSIIFRSDSNGEDLEGYAGAGLYDSVPMDEEEKVVLDYTSDPLVMDRNFRLSILSSIAKAGAAVEELYGSPQDIEGVVKDGGIFVVQTRPQM